MSEKVVLVLSGSARTGSVNGKLAGVAAAVLASRGATVQMIDLAAYPAPVYNGDDEAASGLPESMSALKKRFAQADGIVVVTPEYNGHVPPLLVNTFSWLSRAEEGESGSPAFVNLKAAVMAASPGGLGGVRVIPRLRDFLAELGVMVVPGFVTLKSAFQAFDENGALADEANQQSVDKLLDRLLAEL